MMKRRQKPSKQQLLKNKLLYEIALLSESLQLMADTLLEHEFRDVNVDYDDYTDDIQSVIKESKKC